MNDLSQVVSVITFQYPAEGDTLQGYIESVCGFDLSALGVVDEVMGEEEPSKETVENFKRHIPYFGLAVENILKCVNEMKTADDLPLDKWRGFAQDLKIVMLCVCDSEWVESNKHLIKPAVV